MPEGDVLAGVFEKDGQAVALARPVHVARGATVYVDPRPPREGCDVLVVLDRPGLRPRSQTEDAVLVLRTPGGDRRPDILSDTLNRVVAVWYGISGRTADLVVQSSTEHQPAETLRLLPGKVVTVRRPLRPLPAADVAIRAPERLGELHLEIHDTAQGQSRTVRTLKVTPGVTKVHALPATGLEFELSAGPWTFSRTLDLTAGVDGRVEFDIEPLVVEGTVLLGSERSPGEIAWGTGTRDLVKTTANDDGHYRVELWAPSVYVARVTVAGHEPFQQAFIDVEEPHTIMDLHIPGNQFRVHVTDRSTGKPVAGADVLVSNFFGSSGGITQRESRKTNDDGFARLPPLHTGNAEVIAGAEGYKTSAASALVVEDETKGEQLEIALEPIGEQIHVRVVDAMGRTALGAELRLVAPGDDRALWEGIQASDGGVGVPSLRDDALLLVRHRGAASRVVPFTRTLEPEIRLVAEAPPLVVRVEGIDGDTLPSGRTAMWFGPYRFTTMSLGFLTWSRSGIAARDGIWTAQGLTPADVRIFAWHRDVTGLLGGAYDALATHVPYPWPAVVTIRSVD